MTRGEADDPRAADPIRAAARREVAEALRRVALDPDGTAAAPAGRPPAPPSPSADAKRTSVAPHGAPGPATAPHSGRAADTMMERGGAPWGARAGPGDPALAARRAAFDEWFDRTYPALARKPPAAPAQPPPDPGLTPSHALQPRQFTAARLLLAGARVGDVAARLGVDRHTVSDWTKHPDFQREVRRMAVELPADELVGGGISGRGGEGNAP